MAESFFCLWACGGERCEDFERMREDEGLTELIGHKFPAPQTARDFLERFEAEAAKDDVLAKLKRIRAAVAGLDAGNFKISDEPGEYGHVSGGDRTHTIFLLPPSREPQWREETRSQA